MGDVKQIDVEHVLSQARDALSVSRVFGEPIESDGVTVLPAARVSGGGGGGGGAGEAPDGAGLGEGSGAGFGLRSAPAGVYVIKGGDAVWRPAINAERIALAGIALVALVVWCLRPLARR